MCMNYCVYAIYNLNHKKLYIGQTQDLENRLKLHNNHTFKNSYTSRYDGKWILIYHEMCRDRVSCLQREKQLKSYRGREFIKSCLKNYLAQFPDSSPPAGGGRAGNC